MTRFVTATAQLLSTASLHRHRALITLAGEQSWAEQCATELLEQLGITPLWVSDHPLHRSDCVNLNHSRQWLGRENSALVFDAHAGFDPNIFALLSGTVCAGGPLLLLAPALATWSQHPDPVNSRCSVWGAPVQHSRYLARLARLTPAHSQLLLEQPDRLSKASVTPCKPAITSYKEQEQLLASVAAQFQLAGPQLTVICGDRGRGKSAAIGRIAAELARAGAERLIVSAPRKAAVEVLMAHAHENWPTEAPPIETVLQFRAPDRLCLQPESCDALLLDEMGGIHLGLLQRLLTHYPRLLMAGTVHGYEGAGRGFHTRLRRHIQQEHPHCQWRQLKQPIRWAADDPLEQSTNALLMLDAEYTTVTAGALSFAWLERDQLALDDPLLTQVYGLLAAAHYRTRPLDLRQILDGPNMRIAVLRTRGVIVAACLVAAEGPMNDPELNQHILEGKRRPAGHLLPQLLLQRLQLAAAAKLRYWRIVRIAVQPERQNQGIGSEFISTIEQEARAVHIDCLGSIFAVDTPIFRFWTSAGYQPTLLGDNCEATSGSYALSVFKPLSEPAKTLLISAKAAWLKQRNNDLKKSHPALSSELCSLLDDSLNSKENVEKW